VWSDLRAASDRRIGAEVLFVGTSAGVLDCGTSLDDAGDRGGLLSVDCLKAAQASVHAGRGAFHLERTHKRASTGMISDLDIYRAANLLIRQHGVDAELVAVQRADLMLDRGDGDGQLVWMRIRRAIVELQLPAAGKPN
jgi:hypothetical protein